MKNASFRIANYAICFVSILICVLTFGAQTAWADEGQTVEDESIVVEYALPSTTEDSTVLDEEVDSAEPASEDETPLSEEVASPELEATDTVDKHAEETGTTESKPSPVEGAAQQDNGADNSSMPAAQTKGSTTLGATAAQATSTNRTNAGTIQTESSSSTNAAAAQKTSLKTSSTSKTNANPTGPIANGDYVIRSFVSSQSVLDVAGGSKASGANVQLYSYNGTAAQQWTLKYNASTGLYTIINKVAGKALDVSGASTSNGANIQVWKSNGTKAQQWRIVKDGAGWRIESALTSGFVLDVSNASSYDGTNIQAYRANGTKAQRFELIALKPKIAASTATIKEGAYVLATGTGKVVDIAGGSRAAGANVQQYTPNSTYAQRFYLEPDGNGFYRVFNIGSGLTLDVSNAGLFPGANVQQYTWNGSAAQLWSLRANSDGTTTFISKCNGLALDVSGASTANGANLQMYTSNGSKAQRFTLKKSSLLSVGAVTLRAASSTNRAVDVKGASNRANTALQISTENGTMAQRLIVSKDASGYTLRPLCSGLYIAPSGSSIVQSSKPATWTVSFAKSGARRGIKLSASGKVIAAKSSSNSSALTYVQPSKSSLQSFCPEKMPLIANGVYTIVSEKDSKVLDVANASWQNGANISVYVNNDTGAQAFKFVSAGGDWYRIVNAMTGKAVDVAGAKSANGTNVQQYTNNGTNAQLWKAQLSKTGQFVFVNKATGKALHVNGSNVDIWAKSDTPTQRWSLKSSAFKYDEVVYNAMSTIQNCSSNTNYCIAVDRGNTRTIIFSGSRGNWTPVQNWLAAVGAPSSATPSGNYTIWGRGYSFDGALGGTPYTCYYWTNFLDNVYLFHSIPYHQGTWNVQDDRLGVKASHGCVRLATDNAKWIYDNIPDGTFVCIYN